MIFSNFLYSQNIFLGVGIPCGCVGMLPRNGGVLKVLAGLTLSRQATQKTTTKIEFGEFISIKKYTQLFMIECI
jgi:hypothetical protein